MQERIRICFIGCGAFCKHFVPLFQKHPDVESVSVCDLIPERATAYAEKFQVPIISSFEPDFLMLSRPKSPWEMTHSH